MKLPVINILGAAAGEVEFADDLLIKNKKGTQAVHDAVVGYLANQRLGTTKVKQMGEVAGTGKKPWKQKGTGRARAGSFQSPIWSGGAIAHGPKQRDYSVKMPKKVKALAFRKALSERLLAGNIVVVEEIKLANHKTRDLVLALKKLAPKDTTTLLVTDVVDKNLKLAARNLPQVQIERADALNTYELLRFQQVVATKAAIATLQARCGGKA